MIYSRFGSEVRHLLWYDEQTGKILLVFEDSRDGQPEQVHVSELKADGGIHEIVEAARLYATSTEGVRHQTVSALNECACALKWLLRESADAVGLSVDAEEDANRALDSARAALKANGVSVAEL